MGCPEVDCGSLTGGAYGWAEGAAKPYFGLVAGTTATTGAGASRAGTACPTGVSARSHRRRRTFRSSPAADRLPPPPIRGRDALAGFWHDRSELARAIHRPAPRRPEPEDQADMKILLVEDDERLGRSLARLLEQDRHNVDIATTGETGLELALGENGIDVVILDVGLPDISGLEVARRIRSERRELAILMLTARDTIGDRVVGLDSGADDYVVKPFAY